MLSYRKIIISCITAGILSACSSSGFNSSWMNDNTDKLAAKKINQILIPGSHFSNAYGLDNKNLNICVGETISNSLSTNAKIAKLVTENAVIPQSDFITYLTTQEHNIGDQLNSGIRYLEIQVCLQNDTYYTSNYYLTATLDSIVQQIKNFMNNNPQEIIFIDLDNNLRSENGPMSENDLGNLHDYLQITFGSYLTPKQDWQQLTFKKLWKTKHRIILMSSNPMFTRYYDVLDKNQVVTSNGIAHYTTIKKLTAIQDQLNFPSDSKNDLMITPIYNWFDPERNSITQIETLNNDHLIFDYLSTIPESSPLNIIVGDRNYNNQLVDYTIQINSHR